MFDENADRLNELTRFVMTQRKTAEYDATIAELEEQRTQVGGIMLRDQAAIQYAPKVLSGLHVIIASSLRITAPCSFFLCVGVSLGKLPTKFHYRRSKTVNLRPNMVDRIQSPK